MREALKLWVYFGDSQLTGPELTSDALMDCFARHGVAASVLCRGLEGFGLGRRIHSERFPDVSTDLPLAACAVDRRERIEALLDDVDRVVGDGLVTLEHAQLAVGEEVARSELPPGPGRAAELSVYCTRTQRAAGRARRPAYREAIEILRARGAAAAIALLGVDGTYHGRRERATILSVRRNAPMMIVAVGERETLAATLPELERALERPPLTLQEVAQLKHDGERLEPLPLAADPDARGLNVWQTIRVHARQSAQVEGRALYTELTRRLRQAGAAGATTLHCHWGFSGEERPYGDKLGRLTSHAPTYTTYVDRPAKVAELWPIIDEVTAEHAVVSSLPVPAYRERRDEHVAGGLRLAEIAPAR